MILINLEVKAKDRKLWGMPQNAMPSMGPVEVAVIIIITAHLHASAKVWFKSDQNCI